MNLVEALTILNQASPEDARSLTAFLACGFTPLHLQTFLAAHLRERSSQRRVEVKTGLFGDLAGNIERLQGASSDLLFVVIEWQDLDPRLGIRNLGGWRATDLPDIVGTVKRALARLEKALSRAAASSPTCVCLPTLPLPPLFVTPTFQEDRYEVQLRQLIAAFTESVSLESSVRILNAQLLAELSPPSSRIDVRSDLAAGFPYRLPHASVLAELLVRLGQYQTPQKGLITDLDDTLWAGILGEIGTDGVSWNLDQHTHIHGLYQQFLSSLASAGVLIAVASKNDRTVVEQVFGRNDLLISKENIYPFEVHWGRKSESAGRILKTWNIGPEAVVFIDDSPMEVAEVKAMFPDMECIVFPKNDYQAIWELMKRLRDLFGKSVVSQEDSIRLQSIRTTEALRESVDASNGSLDDFLQSADAVIRFTFGKQPGDSRAFELINKTNQFNLNGRRMSDSDWLSYLGDPSTFLMTVIYEDKYGPLGKIAAVLGKLQGKLIRVDSWVMSCRAFSRRIEHQSLAQLFEKFDAEEICFDYQATSRNGPLHEFFLELLGTPLPASTGLRISRAAFWEKCQSLHQRVEVVSG